MTTAELAVRRASPRGPGRPVSETIGPLVAAARTGESGAVRALLETLKPVVRRYCRARIGGRDLSYLSADDVAQEACLAVLKALPRYQDRGGSFLFLVRAIAANKVADAFRVIARERANPVPELPEFGPVESQPETHVLNADLGAQLGSLLATLPADQQEILVLRIVVGLSAAETGAALGITAGNVRVRQHRALEKLRRLAADRDF
ncbi:sigma-70 family RNA polymerase sigma factor [Amycolatopsis acidicola]|uniref:Sigma-70 family RNA polymerase sigma factor n=1 Tax=Amycolatopsis acidicola TaxID=2596893 RepID=A0A5N0V5H5_9PSEU|nr:RNA polymerase sigma factor ShbA [Amycolatopsis acidicola]KAA9161627.1 sigma-70 family RNA polymerase sigma factor [Amycolatopsis acidicola]